MKFTLLNYFQDISIETSSIFFLWYPYNCLALFLFLKFVILLLVPYLR